MKKVNYRQGDRGQGDKRRMRRCKSILPDSDQKICRYCKHWRRYGFGGRHRITGTIIPASGWCMWMNEYPTLWNENESCSRWDQVS